MDVKKKRYLTLGLVLTLVSTPFSNPSHALTSLQAFQNQSLNWKNCGNALQCTTFKVPLDYATLGTNTFTLSVVRHLATDKEKRIGTLFVNPGGPGGSATAYAAEATQIVSKQILERYDIVGFDPRGVAKSQPIRCLTDQEEESYLASDTKVTTQKDLDSLLSQAKYFATRCAKVVGNKISHVGSLDTAKDMELLRQILKEPSLNFLGKSYGSYLGTLYGWLYPNNVGRFVLDGAVDPNATSATQNLVQAIGFDTALLDYLKQNKKFTQKQIISFINSLRSKPLVIASGRKLTPSMTIVAIASTLYENTSGWPNLTNALDSAINKSDGRPLIDLSDSYFGRDANGHYSNENDISQAISCLDLPEPRTITQMTNDGAKFKARAPVFGPFLIYAGLACKYWKYPSVKKPVIKSIVTNPIMIIGVTKDPATPYVWAKKLTTIFKGSSLVTFNGEGHTGHNRGNNCVDSAVDAYLLSGTLTKSKTCSN